MKTLLIIIIFALIGTLGYIVYDKVLYAPAEPPTVIVVNPTSTEPVMCTMDAKLCPDGSYVGRTGPACEFAACPNSEAGENKIAWNIYAGNTQASNIVYVDKPTTKYMQILATPPAKITISPTAYSCNLAGSDESIVVSAKTEKHVVGRYEYCVTTQTGGAAGSAYDTYSYTTAYNTSTVTFDFSVQYTQCANYDETERKTCEAERAIFSIDSFVNQMFTTYNWNAFGIE